MDIAFYFIGRHTPFQEHAMAYAIWQPVSSDPETTDPCHDDQLRVYRLQRIQQDVKSLVANQATHRED